MSTRPSLRLRRDDPHRALVSDAACRRVDHRQRHLLGSKLGELRQEKRRQAPRGDRRWRHIDRRAVARDGAQAPRRARISSTTSRSSSPSTATTASTSTGSPRRRRSPIRRRSPSSCKRSDRAFPSGSSRPRSARANGRPEARPLERDCRQRRLHQRDGLRLRRGVEQGHSAHNTNLFPPIDFVDKDGIDIDMHIKNVLGKCGVAPNKLLLGLAFYGLEFSTDKMGQDTAPKNVRRAPVSSTAPSRRFSRPKNTRRRGTRPRMCLTSSAFRWARHRLRRLPVAHRQDRLRQGEGHVEGVMIWNLGGDIAGGKPVLLDAVPRTSASRPRIRRSTTCRSTTTPRSPKPRH